MFYRKFAIILAVISGSLAFAGPAGLTAPQPNPGTSRPTNSLPSKIITTDGVTYNAPRLSRIEPDGLLVEFRPDAGGTGLAKLKFAKLPESLQRQFGYDPKKASDYEHEQKLAMQSLTQKLQQDEKARAAALTLLNEMPPQPNLAGAVTVTSSDPVVTYAYFAPDQKPALLGSSVATCQHNYQCHVDFDVHVNQAAAGGPVRFCIDKVRFSLGMSCNIIEVIDPYDYIRLYEEGRRKVYENCYRSGPRIANRIGESMIGREFTSSEVQFENAKARALAEAKAEVEGLYIARLDSVATQANLYYVNLTDHSKNNVDPNQAAQEACERAVKLFQIER